MVHRTVVATLLALFVFACPCSGDLFDRIRYCHKIHANETCPQDYCTYYFRDPGPFLTCCVCEHQRDVHAFYYSLVLLAILLLLFHELCCSFSIVYLIISVLNIFCIIGHSKCRSGQSSDEKVIIEEV